VSGNLYENEQIYDCNGQTCGQNGKIDKNFVLAIELYTPAPTYGSISNPTEISK